jgi:nicotinamidase-related amidase
MRTALIVIDVQESFRQLPSWQAISNPRIADQVNLLAAASRAHGDRVIWVLHAEEGSGGVFDPASGHVRLIDGLASQPGEPVLTKTSHNAFTTTNLQQLLTSQGVGKVIICGIRTEQCCETTARVASDLGFKVTFVMDATATSPIPHWDAPAGRSMGQILADPRTLQATDVMARTHYALAGRFAHVRSVAQLTSAQAVSAALGRPGRRLARS